MSAYRKVSKATIGDCEGRSSGVNVFEGLGKWVRMCSIMSDSPGGACIALVPPLGGGSHGAEAPRSTGFCSLCGSLLQSAGFM